MNAPNPTIAAISTPPGEGAIALIRVTGPDTRRVLETVFRRATPQSHPPGPPRPREATFGRIVDATGAVIDTGVATFFAGPASYTGEDVLELSCHGGIVVAARVLQAILEAGASGAGPGEFTQRAFLNGKLDLTQAEAVMDLIRAQTPRAARAAAEQLEGRIGTEINEIRTALIDVVAHVEAFIDFPDEDIDPATGDALAAKITAAQNKITQLLATADEGRVLREGVRLAICGRPNAGKSSLLNRLLGFDRAIVSPTAGTTRDTIEETISLRGIPFRLVDTAGLRETTDEIEREGVTRARHAIDTADVVIRVVDAADESALADPPAAPGEILVLNKSDLTRPSADSPGLPISCTTGDGLPALVDAIVAAAGVTPDDTRDSLAAINARHQACLTRARTALDAATNQLRAGAAPEFVALDLRDALTAVGEVIGTVDIEDILTRIFSSFCIGK